MADKEIMDWDDAIDPAEVNKPKELLPEGEAFFTVIDCKRDRREFGKLGVCNVADVTLSCQPTAGDDAPMQNVDVALPLHPDMLWKVLQFFTAVGQRKHGDTGAFKPNWGGLESEVGRCVIKHRTFKGRDGTDRKANEIERFLAPEEEYKPKDQAATPRTPTTKKPEADPKADAKPKKPVKF